MMLAITVHFPDSPLQLGCIPTHMSQTAKIRTQGDSIRLNVTILADDAGFIERSGGETMYKSDNILAFCVCAGEGEGALVYYNLDTWSFVEAAKHLETLCRDLDVDPTTVRTRHVSIYKKGNGYALACGLARETPPGEPALFEKGDSPGRTAARGWLCIHTSGVASKVTASRGNANAIMSTHEDDEDTDEIDLDPDNFVLDEDYTEEGGRARWVTEDGHVVRVYQRQFDDVWTVTAKPILGQAALHVNEDGLLCRDTNGYQDRSRAIEVAKEAISRGMEMTAEDRKFFDKVGAYGGVPGGSR